jgi:TIGR03009 family protein
MRQTTRPGTLAALIISGSASLLVTEGAVGQTQRAPRPQSTAGARPVEASQRLERNAAEGKTDASTAPRQAAPAIQNLQMTKELDNILADWERHTAQIKRLEGHFWLYKYESVFETETRADGSFWYETPDKGRMDLMPSDLSKLPKNKSGDPLGSRKSKSGGMYIAKAHSPETWICTGAEIRQFNHGDGRTERTYSEIKIPEQFQGEAIRNSPLPFLFGMKREEAKQRYHLSLGEMHNSVRKGLPAPLIHIVAFPLQQRDANEWSKAEILLHSDTFLPYSIKTDDPAGTSETVYVFRKSTTNGKWWLDNPFTVSTIGYKKLDSRELDPQQHARGKAPAERRTTVLPRDDVRAQ